MRIMVTGGAGFIGSHLVDRLLEEGHSVICLDDLSLGKRRNIAHNENNNRFRFIKIDLRDAAALDKVFKKYRFDCVFHLAANSDISGSLKSPSTDLGRTFMTTYNVLRCMKDAKVRDVVFTSSSAIYGAIKGKINEDSGPILPISLYGAAKAASEAFITSFCEGYGLRAWIIRFPNVVGERATHGVLYDFINKLAKDPKRLNILGDGNQTKPYIYVKDLIDAIIFIWKRSGRSVNYFNVGSAGSTTVKRIARIVIREMGLKGVRVAYSGGKTGWTGDVPRYSYDNKKTLKLGWRPKTSSDDAVVTAARAMLMSNINRKRI